MSREPESDVERLITVTSLSRAWNCPPSAVLEEDCFYVIGGMMVMDAFEKKWKQRDLSKM